MITASELRAARALLGMDQRRLAERAGLSLPTIQRMEASDGFIRGNVDSLVKLMSALNAAGLDVIEAGAASASGGRGLRLRLPPADDTRSQLRVDSESPLLGPHTD
jgi:transcriptional regulator with XRE-family HTH domain